MFARQIQGTILVPAALTALAWPPVSALLIVRAYRVSLCVSRIYINVVIMIRTPDRCENADLCLQNMISFPAIHKTCRFFAPGTINIRCGECAFFFFSFLFFSSTFKFNVCYILSWVLGILHRYYDLTSLVFCCWLLL